MRIAILDPIFFHEISEVTGKDKIIWGGAERYLLQLCKFLQGEGHTVEVFQNMVGLKQNVVKIFEGIKINCINSGGPWQYTNNTTLTALFNELAMFFDLRIYFVTFTCFPQVISPCIAISHGIFWDYIQNEFKNFNEYDRKEYFRRQLYGFTAPDVVVSVDDNVPNVIRALEPGLESKIQTIYNFADCNLFYPNKKRNWERVRVLYPRRLTMLRGCNDFIKASQQFKDYDYFMVGQGHDENGVNNWAQWVDTVPNLSFTSYPPEEMDKVYRDSDICVIPTRAAEGTSLSAIEGMASGLPLITTNVGGLQNVVISGYNALIYNPYWDNLGDLIDIMAQDKDMMRVMGERNRQIALECFDLPIWQARWRKIISPFDTEANAHVYVKENMERITDNGKEKSQEPTAPNAIPKLKKKKLVAMMPVHNEAGRYLERVIKNTLNFADEIVIGDDHSTDDTEKEILEITQKNGFQGRLFLFKANNNWSNEPRLRAELLENAIRRNPDWVIAVDADELFENRLSDEAEFVMSHDKWCWGGFRFYDMWDDEEHYRDDKYFKAGNGYHPRMFKIGVLKQYEWANLKHHCGSMPINYYKLPGVNMTTRVKHLGYMKPSDRIKKYEQKIIDDPNFEFYTKETYEEIKNPFPNLIGWSNINIWQTGKKTIAYPPDISWDTMQQRPHHLMKLAGLDGHRCFFGDHDKDNYIASVEYEGAHNVTVIGGWRKCSIVENVDIMYITSHAQAEYFDHTKYKYLIYDCVDYRRNSDVDLIKKADYVLAASKMLYQRCKTIRGTKNLLYVPNACEYGHFVKAGEPAGNVIGYMGILYPSINTDLINLMAKRWECIVFGRITGDKEIINQNPNINFRGHVHYNLLPNALSDVKVGLIPFTLENDYEMYCAPIKVYEYLAAGRCVVASPIPELEPLAEMGLIKTVPTGDVFGWYNAIEEAMREYPNRKGQEWAKTQTWEHRWSAIKGMIDIL